MRPVSGTVLLSTGNSAGAPGLFRVDAYTSPFRSDDATPGSRACVCACSSWPGRAGRQPGRVLVRLTFPVTVLSLFFGRPPPGFVCPRFGCVFFCPPFPFFPPPLSRPRCLRLFVLCDPGCPGPWRSSFALTPHPHPPPFFFPLVLFCCPAFSATMTPPFLIFAPLPPPDPPVPFFCVFFVVFHPSLTPPRGSLCCCFRCPGPWRFVVAPPPSPPPFFLFVFPFFAACPRLSCLGFSVVSGPGCPWPRRSVSANPTRRLSLSLFFFCCCFSFPLFPGSGRSWCSWPLPRLAGFLFPPPYAALLVVCALRAGAVPPPPWRLLVFGCVSCLVLWCLGLLWAVLCGLWRFAVFFGAWWCWCRAVWCLVVPYCAVFCRAWCRRALLCGVLCCVLLLAVSCGCCFPLFCWCRPLPCCAVLCCAVFCHAWCRRVLLSGVLRCVLSWCAVLSGRRVRCVVWGFPAFPPPSAAVAWSLVVARCCVLSWGAVPYWSVVPTVVRCAAVCVVSCWCRPVASFALAGAVCCCLWLLGVRCWVWLPAVVVRWCALARVVLPRRVARRPAVCFGSLWRAAPLCYVLCSVALCCRVVCAVAPCCPFCLVLWSVWRCVAPWHCLWWVVLFFVVLCSVPPSCRPLPCSAAVWALFGAWCRCPCLLVGLIAWFCFLVARVGPGVLVWPLAALPAVWCAGAVSCGVLRPVLCPVALCCVVVLCCLAVLCVCLCCWFLFFLLSSAKVPCCFSAPLKTF